MAPESAARSGGECGEHRVTYESRCVLGGDLAAVHRAGGAVQELAARHGLAPQIVDPVAAAAGELQGPQLEVKVRAAQATVDLRTWRERLGMIEGRVCRIEFPPKVARGTGFSIGPDRVLTNYHVIETVVDGDFRPEKVVLRFDCLVGSDGVEVAAVSPTGWRLAG